MELYEMKWKGKANNTTTIWAKATLLYNTFSKGEGIWVEFKEGDKLANCIPHQISIIVEPPAIMENIAS